MAGVTDQDLRRIERFVETPPRQRTPHILTPDEESEGRANAASGARKERGLRSQRRHRGRDGRRGDRMSPGHALLDRLAGTDCPFREGSVAPGEYRGNAAAVCGACGTPTVQPF